MADPGIVVPLIPSEHAHLVPWIAAIHAGCINHDRTISLFLPPVPQDKLLRWWKERIAGISDKTHAIYIVVSQLSTGAQLKGPDVKGVVLLEMPRSDTGSHRGSIETLLVQPGHRRKGAAKALLAFLEADFATNGRKLLTTNAETGSIGLQTFKKMGFAEIGSIPEYASSPAGGLRSFTFLYKQL